MDVELLRSIIFFLMAAFLPSILWIVWLVRKAPGGPGFASILAMFIWGAVFAVIIAIVLSILVPGFSPWQYGSPIFFMAVIVAPLVEEFAKPLGLGIVEAEIDRVRDGIILGATAGLGFAATENMLYGLAALSEGGWTAFLITAVLRGIAACALHASATAMTGRGYAWAKLNLHPVAIVIPFFLVAAFMHGLYNYLAIQGTLVALMGAILFALGSIAFTGYSVQ
jgi:RsiW-degrading membrane proteinase PrsW (M82 family)